MNASAPDAAPHNSSPGPRSTRTARPANDLVNGRGGAGSEGASHDRHATVTHRTGKLSALAVMPADTYDAMYTAAERAALSEMVMFVSPRLTTTATLPANTVFPHAEALFTGWGSPKLDENLLAMLPALRVVFHSGGSIKAMVSDELWERGIRITSAARVNAVPVCEFTIAQIILALKQVLPSARATREARRFVRRDASIASAYGSTVGLLSLGVIGRMVAARLRDLDVTVIGYDPCVNEAEAAQLGVQLFPLEEVFARADVVSCHTPLLEETRSLLRAHHFSSMKPHATFINTARGGIVHEPELIEVLQRRPDLYAILDVTEPEPPPPDSALYTLPNVLLTPHLSGSVGPECRRMSQMMIEEVRRYLAGQLLNGEVTREQLPTLA